MARAPQLGTTRTLEFPALAAGVLAFALLGGIAWSPAVDPGLAGESELSRQARSVSSRVVDEWRRAVREEGWGPGETLRYSPAELRENPTEPSTAIRFSRARDPCRLPPLTLPVMTTSPIKRPRTTTSDR